MTFPFGPSSYTFAGHSWQFVFNIALLTTKHLPIEILILKFCDAVFCAKYRKKNRNWGFMYVFEAKMRANLMFFVTFRGFI